MDDQFNFETILVPYNATIGAERGLRAAIEIAKKIDAQIILLTCVENQSIMTFFSKQTKSEKFDQEKKIIEKELKKISSDIMELNKPIKQVILESSFAPHTIVEYAEKINAGMVVIGQTKLIVTEGKYHESMANYLLRDLKRPLFVIK